MAIAAVTGGDNRYWHMVSTIFSSRHGFYAHQSSQPLYHFVFYNAFNIIESLFIIVEVISSQDLTQVWEVTTFRTKLWSLDIQSYYP